MNKIIIKIIELTFISKGRKKLNKTLIKLRKADPKKIHLYISLTLLFFLDQNINPEQTRYKDEINENRKILINFNITK